MATTFRNSSRRATKLRRSMKNRRSSSPTPSPARVFMKLSSTINGTANRLRKKKRRNSSTNCARWAGRSRANTNDMLNPDAKLAANIFDKPDMAPTRDGFGKGVVEAGKADERVVVLSADLEESTRADSFQKTFPERFIQVGVAEQNLATVGAGMANYGKIPFITSYATFSPGRNWEQIRTTIAINNVPVKVCGMHAGLLTGPDGATHQALEDIALMRVLPHFLVISPCDAE